MNNFDIMDNFKYFVNHDVVGGNKMYEFEFNRDGVVVRKMEVDDLVGVGTIEKRYTYDELAKIDGIELKIKMPIKPVKNGDVLVAIVMDVIGYKKLNKNNLNLGNEDWIRTIRSGGVEEKIPRSVKERLDAGNHADYIYTYTLLRYKEGTLPNTIAKIIKEKGEISDEDLRKELKKRQYSGKGGGIGATIKVLRDITKEIEVIGRGVRKIYRWIA